MDSVDFAPSLVFGFLLLCLVCGVAFMLHFKSVVHNIRNELKGLDEKIVVASRTASVLEVDCALSKNTTKIKLLADQHLSSNFTRPDRVVEVGYIPSIR